MSLQQGREGVRSTATDRYGGLFAGFCPVSELFLRHFQRPNTAPPFTAAGAPSMGRTPHRCAARRRRGQERPSISGLADFLTRLEALMRPRPGL